MVQKIFDELGVLLKGQENVLLACSGGPDSMFLLHILHIYAQRDGSPGIAIAYVDHRLRADEELRDERVLIEQRAQEYGIPCHMLSAEAGEILKLSRERGGGLEEAARIVRYRMLEACRLEHGYDSILTAHNEDDQIETLLMRFFRGSGPEGLRGIARKQQQLLRPMLMVSKSEVLKYLQMHGISYSIDTTNTDTAIERNALRKSLIPVIETMYPGYRKGLNTLIRKMGMVTGELSEHEPSWAFRDIPEGICSDLSEFLELTRYMRMRLCYRAWELVRGGGSILPFAVIEPLLELENDTLKGENRTLFEYDGILCHASKESLFWKRMVVHHAENRYLKVVDSTVTELFPGVTLVREEHQGVDASALCLDGDRIIGPLVVRSAVSGDNIACVQGGKRLQKLFNDWKIPRQERWKIPVIADSSGVIGVLGRSFGGKDRISVQHKIENKDDHGDRITVLRIVHGGDYS